MRIFSIVFCCGVFAPGKIVHPTATAAVEKMLLFAKLIVLIERKSVALSTF